MRRGDGEMEMGKENVVRTPEHGGRADVLGQAVERERGDDRAGLAARGGHAVCGRAEARREDLCGVALWTERSQCAARGRVSRGGRT